MSGLRVTVVGSAAGGGYPQWNCRGPVSSLFWDEDARVQERTQSSIAVSSDGENWGLINCSPDIRQQIIRTPVLQPKTPPRHSPIKSILLTNGDIDHVAGLLTLREKQAYNLYATSEILGLIEDNPIFRALDPDFVIKQPIALEQDFPLVGGIVAKLFSVPGKIPLYMEDGTPEIGVEGEATVGVELRHGGGQLAYYIPGCAALTPALAEKLEGAALVMFDGTLWTDDEMIRQGVGKKTGQRMGHISMSGADGSIAAFDGLDVARKVFVHINNTNPVLIDGSPERNEAETAGWEISYDGMEIAL